MNPKFFGMALISFIVSGFYTEPALSESVIFECDVSIGPYYIKISEPSIINRLTNNDFRSNNVQIRHADDAQFTSTNVTRSDENGISFIVRGALRGFPLETDMTQVVLSRADPPQGFMTHWKVIGTESGVVASKKLDWQSTQLGPERLLRCHRFVKAF